MAGDDLKYKRWLEGLPCWCCGAPPPSVVHHKTGAGLALRASDRDGIPMNWKHHLDFHDSKGAFRDWTKAQKKEWQRHAIRLLNERYARLHRSPDEPGSCF